ncbi:MAG: hypothetical protein JSR59_20690 [Proteobacteria bacterium]|nr:hypothetical protein [Pseudomonadota bacterium]
MPAAQSAGAGAPAMAAAGPNFQSYIPESYRDAAGSAVSQGMSQPAAQQHAAMAQANAGGQQASQPGAPAAGGMPGGGPAGTDYRQFIPAAFRASVPENPPGQ